ncbi:MAG: hypothetical protein AAGD05_11565, partial [Bacteroidota bacterium]
MSKSTNPLPDAARNESLPPTAQSFIHPEIKTSAYWTVLQSGLATLDLCQIDHDNQQFAHTFIQDLLQKAQVNSEVKATSRSSGLLKHWYHEAQNRLRRTGNSNFGFGFPMLILHDPDQPFRPIVAPLFIWSLQIQPSPNRMDAWSIKYSEKSGVEPNYYLLKHLEQQHGETFQQSAEALFSSEANLQQTLPRFCYDLITHMGLQDERSTHKVWPLPSAREALASAHQGAIRWSGVFGLFAPFNGALTQALPSLTAKAHAAPLPRFEHPFGSFAVDPFQKKALQLVQQSART